ncbi:MAG TPA: alpha/beta hydrolase fold domain-containing protein, partial [Fontimonas sp.]
ALIITADIDPLRDDGARFARKLADAGVPGRYVNYPGMPHGFFFMPRICSAAAQGIAEISRELDGMAKAAAASARI